MLRSALHRNVLNKSILIKSKVNRNQCVRWQSTNENKSVAPKLGLIIGGSVVLLTSGAIAYARYDSTFRKSIHYYIPYSETLLNSIIGPITQNNERNPKQAIDDTIESGLLRKKRERERSGSQVSQNSGVTVQSVQSVQAAQQTQQTPQTPQQTNIDQSSASQTTASTTTQANENTEVIGDQENVEQLVTEERTKEAHISSQRDEDDNTVDLRVALELQRKGSELELDYQRKINKVREKLEDDLRQQLKRQLAAHNDYLHEQLQALTNELERKHQSFLEESNLQVKDKYQTQLSESLYKIHSLEHMLKVREELDKEERAARELWLVVQSLKDVLKQNTLALNGEYSPRSVNSEISSVKDSLEEYLSQNALIKLALESIPKEALEVGVYSEGDLINRFSTVDRVCRRVALIKDENSSLYRYFLSYLQSLLVFNDSKIPLLELEDQELADPSKWDTFDILTRVRYSLRHNNLEQALRYANQLKGEPRNVARDWIRDTRTHLEMRQAVHLLQATAASISVQVVN